jgi:putative phosphoserine phosphatase/1-acylglycerol-3-phosphate O-acyltransferase
MPAIAFFDFDGTLLTGDSGLLCASPSVRLGLLRPGIVAEFVGRYALYKMGLGTRQAMQRVGFRCYRGRTLSQLRATTRDLHARYLSRHVSPAMKHAVELHRALGHRLVILTGAAHFFAEPFGEEWRFDEVHGTRMVYEDGICNGLVDGEILDGVNKRALAERLAREAGTTLARCSFYTDHVADLPLLEAVGRPIVVGQGKGLAKIARDQAWPWVPHERPTLVPPPPSSSVALAG